MVHTRTIRLDTPDADFIELHRLDCLPDAPRLLLLHGLEGSPASHYARAFLHHAALRRWGADVMVFRSCGREMNRTCRFYHSGETGDLDFVIRMVRDEFPRSPLFLAGVSLGGNVALKWLGEQEERMRGAIQAAAAISVPFDLARSSRRIGTGFSRLYEKVFLRTLKRKAVNIAARYPGALDVGQIAAIATLRDFDDLVTAPLHGFRNADDYYFRSSAIRWIHRIRVPTLLLSARDDPFLPEEVLCEVQTIAGGNPALTLEFLPHGGHVGFVSGQPWNPVYHAEARACDFLQASLAEQVRLQHLDC